MGDSSSIRWRVELATNLASRRHQSKLAKDKGSCLQPARVSTNASPGRLMQSSVISGSLSKGRNARKLSSSAEASAAETGTLRATAAEGAPSLIADSATAGDR